MPKIKASKTCSRIGHRWPTVGADVDGRRIKGGRCKRCGKPHPNRAPQAHLIRKLLSGMTPEEKQRRQRKVERQRQAERDRRRSVDARELERYAGTAKGQFARVRHAAWELFLDFCYALRIDRMIDWLNRVLGFETEAEGSS